MRINYEVQRPTENRAIERVHSRKAVRELVKDITRKAREFRKGSFEITLEFEPTRAELNSLGNRLSLHHNLEILHHYKVGEEITLTVQRFRRK